MQKEPFVISLSDADLPNLSRDGEEDYGLQFGHTSLWQDGNNRQTELLERINDTLNRILLILKNSGKD